MIADAGWKEIEFLMMDTVNNSIIEAAGERDHISKTYKVNSWDAQRIMLDNVLNHIKQTREERDRLLEERREQNGGSNRQAF